MLMGTTDTIIAGRASPADLAGLGVGNSISMTVFMFISGVIFAVTPIVAQLYGAKKFKQIGQKLREVLWIALFLGILIAVLFMNMGFILNNLPIDKSITDISIKYLQAIALGFTFLTVFTCLRCYSEGMKLTVPVFVIAFCGMILNIPLDLMFVYGWFGAPKLGGVGCGIATTIVSFIMMVAMFFYIAISKNYKKTQPFSKFSWPSSSTTKEAVKLGVPIGLGIFIELSMFSGAGIILAVLGESIVASHYIAINIASLFFMIPLSIGLAAATRVGNLIGEENPIQAKTASHSTIYLCIIAALVNIAVILVFREFIVGIYTTDIIVFNLTVGLLIFAALFQLPDGIQMGALGSLRGYKDTFVPMILLFISYWIFALPVGYYLTNFGFGNPYGASGMWIGMIIGLSIFSILSILRLRWVTRKSLRFSI
jgi:MATE family multidrug resistance protein